MKILENTEKKGIELYFDDRPSKKIINILKSYHFRWHSTKKCWYAKSTKKNIELITCINNNDIDNIQEPEKKENINAFGIKVGDIFYSSWRI